jgi:hypothetical protein
MLLATPAPTAPALKDAFAVLSPTHESFNLKETDLAWRWDMNPKTLQRWRMEGRGPSYLKLGKRVLYPLNAVIAFEKCVQHVSTSQREITGGGGV